MHRSQDVDDAAQEAFLKAYKAEKTQEIRSPKSFLFQIAKNIALQELTKKSKMITDYIEDLSDSAISWEGRTLEDQMSAEQCYAWRFSKRSALNLFSLVGKSAFFGKRNKRVVYDECFSIK